MAFRVELRHHLVTDRRPLSAASSVCPSLATECLSGALSFAPGTANVETMMKRTWKSRTRWIASLAAVVLLSGLLVPNRQMIPVAGASSSDWNHQTFWHHPWGKSGVHKGIDIFAPRGTPVIASTSGLVISTEELLHGGKVISILGPRWRVHYYAHLQERSVSRGSIVRLGDRIGAVGNTGNATGKPSHLHYAMVTLVPYPWRIRWQAQGWKRMHFLDPDAALR